MLLIGGRVLCVVCRCMRVGVKCTHVGRRQWSCALHASMISNTPGCWLLNVKRWIVADGQISRMTMNEHALWRRGDYHLATQCWRSAPIMTACALTVTIDYSKQTLSCCRHVKLWIVTKDRRPDKHFTNATEYTYTWRTTQDDTAIKSVLVARVEHMTTPRWLGPHCCLMMINNQRKCVMNVN